MARQKNLAEIEKIVQAFGKVIEETSQEAMAKYPSIYYPISLLPYPKEKIREALNTAILHTEDEKMAEALKSTLVMLDWFVDDAEANKNNKEILYRWKRSKK